MKKGIYIFNFSLFIFFIFTFFSPVGFVQAAQVEIWATSTAAWTTTFGNAGPVDNGTANNAITPQIAVAPNGMVYMVFAQVRGISNHIYLSRYDGTDVRIWDTGAKAWTTTFADGDPIDLDGITGASAPQIAIDSNNKVYVTFVQMNGSENHIYLSRYDGTDVRIWDNGTASWTLTLANGDPIDKGTATAALTPQIAIDSTGQVYVTYTQSNGSANHVYLSRYNGTRVEIWGGGSGWTNTFASGSSIDLSFMAFGSLTPQLVVDSTDKVYVTFSQNNGAGSDHIYLSRYDGTDVRIWTAGGWSLVFTGGVAIDTNTPNSASVPQIARDSANNIYIAYLQYDGMNYHVYISRYNGADVRIWDNGAPAWTTTFANGDPVDLGTALHAQSPDMAIDSNNKVYLTYKQNSLIYLSRYDGTDFRIWDTAGWTTTFANGDSIDTGAGTSYIPQLAIDSSNNVYVTYRNSVAILYKLYLSRYNATAVRAEIWDNDTTAWTTTFANGDGIDTGNIGGINDPQIAKGASDNIYVTYPQSDGAKTHIYLSRYNSAVAPPAIVAPTITVSAATAIATTTATLNGDITDTGGENNTVRGFEYGLTTAYGTATSTAGSYGTGTFSFAITGLTASTTYHFRAFSTNSAGTSSSTDLTFETDAVPPVILAPTATSSAATAVGTSSVTLHGNITATGGEANTIRGFEYGLTTAYGSVSSTTGSYLTGEYTADISGLSASTVYHFRAFSTNTTGTGTSTDLTFTTSALPPVITTPTATSSAATSITTSGATLHGNITNTGGENNTVRGFEYGLTTAYGSVSSTTGSYSTGEYTADISGLSASTVYHFRAFSTNTTGTGTSTDLTFTTSSSGGGGGGRTIINPITLTATTPASCGSLVDLSWSSYEGADSYKIFINGEYLLATTSLSALLVATSTDVFSVSGLINNSEISGSLSNSVSVTPSLSCPFSPPVLSITESNTCGSKVKLSWTTVTGAIKYKVFRNDEQVAITTNNLLEITANSGDTFYVKATSVLLVDTLPSNSVKAVPSEPCGCQGAIPDVGYESCPGTRVSETATWTLVNSCPIFFAGTCQFRAVAGDDILPPVIPPVQPPVVPPVVPPVNPPVNPPTNPPMTPPGGDLPVVPGGTRPIVSASTTEKLFTGAKLIFESQTGSAITKVVATIGILAGGLAATSVVDLLSMPFRLWGLLLSIIGLKKRNRPWGTVYDSITKQPIDPAYVTLKNMGTNEENTSITDLDGRYGFLVTPGQYTLTANKTNYTFPSEKMRGQAEDAMYNNLYFGEELNISGDNLLIDKNIPIDPIKFDWNEFVKGKKKLMKFYSQREKVTRLITDWTFRVGFVVSVVSIFIVPAPYNLIIFSLYLLLAIARKFGLKFKALGALLEADGSPLSFAIIRVFDAELKVQITNKVADKIGRYYCLVPKGKYFVKIEKKNDDESYSEIFTSEPFDASNGIIKKSFTV